MPWTLYPGTRLVELPFCFLPLFPSFVEQLNGELPRTPLLGTSVNRARTSYARALFKVIIKVTLETAGVSNPLSR
jgi:hypothetical protein